MDLCVTYNKFRNMLAAAYVAYMHLYHEYSAGNHTINFIFSFPREKIIIINIVSDFFYWPRHFSQIPIEDFRWFYGNNKSTK